VKFMVRWRVHDDKRHEALTPFSQMTSDDDRADRGDRIKLIGRWHDLRRMTGVAIFGTDDAQAIARWILNWNSVLDVDVTPVVDDEAKAIGKQKFG
jgi:Protein of unknown function (DUF3303)